MKNNIAVLAQSIPTDPWPSPVMVNAVAETLTLDFGDAVDLGWTWENLSGSRIRYEAKMLETGHFVLHRDEAREVYRDLSIPAVSWPSDDELDRIRQTIAREMLGGLFADYSSLYFIGGDAVADLVDFDKEVTCPPWCELGGVCVGRPTPGELEHETFCRNLTRGQWRAATKMTLRTDFADFRNDPAVKRSIFLFLSRGSGLDAKRFTLNVSPDELRDLARFLDGEADHYAALIAGEEEK